MPTVGYQGFKSLYRPVTVAVNHRKDPFFNINPLRPRLKDINIQATGDFQKMTDGFKRAVTATNKDKATASDALPEDIKVPISGYTGHRMGYKS
jgi:hypothetical protein